MPILTLENPLSTTEPVTCATNGASCPHFLSAWAGLGVLGRYAVIALAAGGWLPARRDACGWAGAGGTEAGRGGRKMAAWAFR